MSTHVVITCDSCPSEIRSTAPSPGAARARAATLGWRFDTATAQPLDICPTCSGERAEHAAWTGQMPAVNRRPDPLPSIRPEQRSTP